MNMSEHTIVPIDVPDATLAPAAYVRALADTLGDRDPLRVYAATAATLDELCGALTDEQWQVPLAAGEWTAAQITRHLLDVDIVYGFRWRHVLTHKNPSYPR